MLSEEDKNSVLKARAEKLAQVRQTTENIPKSQAIDLIQFILGNEIYAVEASFVSEVYPLKDVTKLPGTPSFLYGIMNVRRRIVAIIDLAEYFNLPKPTKKGDLEESGIILHKGRQEFAIVTQQVLGALKTYQENIQSPLPSLTALQQDFVKGVTSEGIVILNCEKLLTDKNLTVDDTN